MKYSNLRTGIVFKQYRIVILKELFRKTIHLCSAMVPTLLALAYWPVMGLLFLALTGYILSEYVRFKGVEVPLISKITTIAARKRDENKIVLGPITLVIGIICSSLLWNLQAARIGIYALAFGDGLASLVGKMIGRIHIPFTNGKTVAGSLACFFAVFVSCFAVCQNASVALVLSIMATLVEVIPLKDLDNIIIPILIGGLSQYLLC